MRRMRLPTSPLRGRLSLRVLLPPLAILFLAAIARPVAAAPINNPVAEFTGLDKITGRTITFDVLIDETVQFGALRVTPRVCHTRPPTEPEQTTAFVEVDEITLSNEIQRIFTGWMFAASPGLHAVEHPVYDVWLVDCKIAMGEPDSSAAATPDAAAEEGSTPRLPDLDGAPAD